MPGIRILTPCDVVWMDGGSLKCCSGTVTTNIGSWWITSRSSTRRAWAQSEMSATSRLLSWQSVDRPPPGNHCRVGIVWMVAHEKTGKCATRNTQQGYSPPGERGNGFCCSREPHVWMAENCAKLKSNFQARETHRLKKLKSRTCVRLLGLVTRFKRVHQGAQKVGATVEIAVRVAPQAKPLCQLLMDSEID